MAIEHLSAQSTFVRRRGQVTNMHHHFETLKIYPYQDPHKAAYDEIRLLAELVQTLILQAMQEVPLRSLFDRTDQVRIPIAAFRLENDYTSCARHGEDGLLMALADPPHVPFQVKVTAKTACCHDRFVDEAELRCSDDFCAMNMVVVQEVSRDWNEKTMKVARSLAKTVPDTLWQNLRGLLSEQMSLGDGS
eukprot:g15515.t1